MTRLLLSGIIAITLVSVPEEIAIGRQAHAQARRELAQLNDQATRQYVASVGARLARHAAGPKYPYSFTVANYREINAFALPGGPIWINRGVLQAARTEAQLAGVIAHEIAHVAQRHAASQLTKGALANFGLGLLGAFLGNAGGANAAQVAAGVMANGVFLKFSRDDEREADRVGLQILRRAGWDGRGMPEMFAILRAEQQRDPSAVELFFSTHPSPEERIRTLGAQAGRGGGRRDSQEFQRIRTRLRTLPAAKPMPR